ncbi:hypothetical protein BAE44_0017564 [Dichanthelium oligosanthes]|uniref:Uncharacterized protein n=1 Tax=Dichanthelium oligosanthes TaxID=888268 RepID=A0A1E5V8H5_9POAL|nr:hypothetical protein BAE44_0017564 [Dichanthelium oligosanthes]
MDRAGSFCMYANPGGPFQSINEADDAIDRYLDELRHRAVLVTKASFLSEGHCNGCRNNGSPGMKHPNNTGAYTGGRLDGYLPFGCEDVKSNDVRRFPFLLLFMMSEAEVERLRARFEGMDDPNLWERIRRLTPTCSTKRNKES